MAKQREREVKTMPAWTKAVDGRKVVGITAVTGNVDDGGDRIIAGAFAKTIAESAKRIRHLWQHGADGFDYGVTPPIAAITRIQEVGRDALPQDVITAAPMATGGLEVEREYLPTPRGDEILAAYKAGIPLEMSIGYETIIRKWIEDDRDRATFGHYRDLIEIKLYDTSDVNWGMNKATVGSKDFDGPIIERRLALLVERMKTLRVEELEAAELDGSLLIEFRALCAKFGGAGGDAITPPIVEPQPMAEAEPSPPGISLTSSFVELRRLELALLR